MVRVGTLVRDAVGSDASVVSTLLTALGYPASTDLAAERIAFFAADPLSRVQVADADGEVVGLAATHLVPRLDSELLSCRIVDLVVAPDHRRRGVGRMLLEAAEAEAGNRGAQRLDLTSGDWRPDAHCFYERLGLESSARGYVTRVA
jgi:GNAT superfamily N-acetyltransferase